MFGTCQLSNPLVDMAFPPVPYALRGCQFSIANPLRGAKEKDGSHGGRGNQNRPYQILRCDVSVHFRNVLIHAWSSAVSTR